MRYVLTFLVLVLGAYAQPNPDYHIHSGAAVLTYAGSLYTFAYRYVNLDVEDASLPVTLLTRISLAPVNGSYPALPGGVVFMTSSVTATGHQVYKWGQTSLELIPYDGQLRAWTAKFYGQSGTSNVRLVVQYPATETDPESDALVLWFVNP